MRRGVPSDRVLRALIGLAIVLAGPGCAGFRKRPDAAPPAAPPAATAEEKAGPEAGEAENGHTNGNGRLVLDPEAVHSLQTQAIEEQRGGTDDCLFRRKCGFACWLDRAHETWYRRMDNAVRTVDTRWLSEDSRYDPELSTFRLRTMFRAGGRSSEGDTDYKVRFRGDLALPGLERKLHLTLENVDEEALPGTDPMRQKDDTRLGLRTAWNTLKGSELDLGGGLKWRDSNPVAYFDVEWRGERAMGGGRLRLTPRGYYFTDNGFGQVTSLTWTKPVGDRKYFQVRTAEGSSESQTGVQFEQTFRWAYLRASKGRGWVVQASVFPHLVSSDWIWDDSLVNVTWRDAFYRKWIYYTITPQVQFPKEDEYEPRPSLSLGLEILFGGKIGDLI